MLLDLGEKFPAGIGFYLDGFFDIWRGAHRKPYVYDRAVNGGDPASVEALHFAFLRQDIHDFTPGLSKRGTSPRRRE